MSGEGFLSRWSRKKREDARDEPREPQEAAAESVAIPAEPAPAPAPEAEPTLSDEELAALPPIETIDATTDITGYLRKGVPAALKNAALRRVWATTPAVRDYLDPAREYAYDWNVPGGVPGDGPLSPDFDAKALADRLFAKREPPVEKPPEDVRETQEPSVQNAQHNEDTNPARSEEADDVDTSSDPQTTAALENREPTNEQPAAHMPQDPAELRPRPRRHGGATPV
ncbi:DUF3306 domain-containing protein [Salinarimonas ramus]|uniref:DUF3306 domain-containing protein n=1 Tax=Salinarimonas ramus TaxID=690164 RepID=A0A917QEH8_9HYPH|nr:DUF3306 domain-containing protein [Salinarimonas ramus]GGK45191.1 hypothetical protein GCM10011322_35450 [Salinarimonas ramus]